MLNVSENTQFQQRSQAPAIDSTNTSNVTSKMNNSDPLGLHQKPQEGKKYINLVFILSISTTVVQSRSCEINSVMDSSLKAQPNKIFRQLHILPTL